VTETNVFQLSQPGTFVDPLTEVLRNGARALLAQAIEIFDAHATSFVSVTQSFNTTTSMGGSPSTSYCPSPSSSAR
jgi:hypothetical protein